MAAMLRRGEARVNLCVGRGQGWGGFERECRAGLRPLTRHPSGSWVSRRRVGQEPQEIPAFAGMTDIGTGRIPAPLPPRFGYLAAAPPLASASPTSDGVAWPPLLAPCSRRHSLSSSE